MTTVTARDAAASTRDRLVAATLAEMDEKGYSAMRVDDVARRAGLTSGAIYGVFRTKHDLLVSALLDRDPTALRDAVARKPKPSDHPVVLEAALAVLDERGYRGVRVGDVARRAGLGADDLRAAYPTKHHLLAAAMVARDPEAFRDAVARADGARGGAADDESSTRERLMGATLAVLDELGYRKATVGEIARRAGLTTGAIYANYGSKQDLLNTALRMRYEELFRSALDHAEDAHSTGGLLGALGGILTKDASVQHKALIEIMAAASRDEPVQVALAAQLARRDEVIGALIDAGKEAGLVAPDVPTRALTYVVQLIALGNVVGQAIGMETPAPAEVVQALTRLGDGLRPPIVPRR